MDSSGFDLGPTFSPIYWGTVISLVLGGITILQAYIYFPHPSDRTVIQVVAGSMVVFDFVSSALIVQSVYYYLVPHFGSLLPLTSITPELSAECLLSTLITLISQFYFVAQLHAVTKTGKGGWWIPVAVAIFAVLAFVFGVACTTVMFIHHHSVLAERAPTFSAFFGLAKGFGAITDIIATIAMCKLLSDSRTGLNQTNSILKSLMNYVIHRGVLVTLIQVLMVITFYVVPKRLIWLAFHLNVTKLYANTFFAMLNARETLRQKHATVSASSFSTHSFSKHRFTSNPGSYGGRDCERQETDDKETYNMATMPTVTKTVVISDI